MKRYRIELCPKMKYRPHSGRYFINDKSLFLNSDKAVIPSDESVNISVNPRILFEEEIVIGGIDEYIGEFVFEIFKVVCNVAERIGGILDFR